MDLDCKHTQRDSAMPASVIIVGGSLSGLLHGLYFKHQGVDVTILEQDPRDERSSHNAGIMVGPSLQAMLQQHDRTGQAFSVATNGMRWSLRRWQDVWKPATAARSYTNWAYLYRLLRANFDGHVSKACPVPPAGKVGDGQVRYLMGRRVTSLHYADGDDGGAVELEAVDEAGHCESYRAELVIGADGSRSTMRKLLNAPQTLPLTYAGHFCWRGSVPVRHVSKETADFFLGSTCFDLLGNKSYILCYVIPTDDGDFGRDDLLLNWLLYQDLEEGSDEEAAIFTDKYGRRAQRTVGRGLLDPEVWETRRAQLTARMVAPFAEVVNKSPTPFVTKISEALGSQASFYGGRVVLVGDALASYRPNLGRATDQAAAHCLALAEVLQNGGKIDDGNQVAGMAAWNRYVCRENEKVLLLSRIMSEATRGTWWSLFKAVVGFVKFHRRKE